MRQRALLLAGITFALALSGLLAGGTALADGPPIPGDATVVGGSGTPITERIDPDKVKIEFRDAPLISPGQGILGLDSLLPLSGTLDADVAHLYGPYYYGSGDLVSIDIQWSPAGSDFKIGLTRYGDMAFYGCTVTNGSGNCPVRVNTAGWFYPTVWNLGPYTATYSGTASW